MSQSRATIIASVIGGVFGIAAAVVGGMFAMAAARSGNPGSAREERPARRDVEMSRGPSAGADRGALTAGVTGVQGTKVRNTPPAAGRPVAARECLFRTDPRWAFHLRASDTPSRDGALEMPGGTVVSVLARGTSDRDNGSSHSYHVRIHDGDQRGRVGVIFIRDAELEGRADCAF